MSASYKLNKKCKICGKLLLDTNKSGYCNKHRPRTGINNSFYGKHHSKETIQLLKDKCSIASEEKWKDPIYREKVITGETGKKRTEKFKENQRKAAYKQFEDFYQREIRSIKMKENWELGIIISTENPSINKSKQEKEFIKYLSSNLSGELLLDQTLNYIDSDGRSRWLFPDGIYNNYVIEYNGSYWHADPRLYKADDIVHHNHIASDIWDRDNHKKEIYNKLGYEVITVWSKDFLEDKNKCISEIIKIIKPVYNSKASE